MAFRRRIFISLLIILAVKSVRPNLSGLSDPGANDGADEENSMHHVAVPGRLPDSVIRELAWFGISQLQPMLLSSKNRMVAVLTWMHALNRPHVVMETAPENLLTHHRVDRTFLAEEAARWSKDQKINHDNVMETLRTGGNGITIRTVVGHEVRTHTVLVHAGQYYKCVTADPYEELYKTSPKDLHNRMCMDWKPAELLEPNIDPCIEGEFTQLEYDFPEGWHFCFGAGDRPENSHFFNGTLNCGNKTKVSYHDFLESCAIDNNVVIHYKYFGDEPRREVMDNGTLCPSWLPCELWYLYRIEPPDDVLPAFPTTTPDPCDTKICSIGVDEVIENVPVPDDYVPPWQDKYLLKNRKYNRLTTKTTPEPLSDDDDDTTAKANAATTGKPAEKEKEKDKP